MKTGPKNMRESCVRMDEKIAAAAARRLGFTDNQKAAYLAAVRDAPAVYDDGRAVPIHDIGIAAAVHAGGIYATKNNPSLIPNGSLRAVPFAIVTNFFLIIPPPLTQFLLFPRWPASH